MLLDFWNGLGYNKVMRKKKVEMNRHDEFVDKSQENSSHNIKINNASSQVCEPSSVFVKDFSSHGFAEKTETKKHGEGNGAKATNNKKSIENEKALEKTAEPAKEEKKLAYKVYGQDITLSNGDIIDYYKTRMKIMVMRFMLVGRIDDKGVYRIKDEIKLDLINMNKEISDSGEDYFRAEARYISKIFYFNIKIKKIDEQKAKASLYLSEFVDDFLEDEYIVSHIADYTDVYDAQFRVKVRKAFNLHDTAIKNDEFKMPALAVLMSDEYDINEYIGGLYDLASQIYVMRMLKLLEASGDPTCQEILKRYKELSVDKDANDTNEKYKFTKFKALLDRAIDEKGGLEKLNVNKDELKSIVNEVNKSVKAIDGVQKRPGAIEVMKTDKGSSGGSFGGGAKKKTAGKSAGGGGNSGAKKDKKGSSSTSKSDKSDDKSKKKPVTGDPSAVLDAYKAGKEIQKRIVEAVNTGKAIIDALSGRGDDENEDSDIEPTQQEDVQTPTGNAESQQEDDNLEDDDLSNAFNAMSVEEAKEDEVQVLDEDKEEKKEEEKHDEGVLTVEIEMELEDDHLVGEDVEEITGEMTIDLDSQDEKEEHPAEQSLEEENERE